jgi:hypothetical protein
MIAGLLLAVGCAVAGSVGVQLKQRGAVAAPTSRAIHCATQSTRLAPSGGRWAGCSRWVRGCCTSVRCRWRRLDCRGRHLRPPRFRGDPRRRFFGFQLGRGQWTRAAGHRARSGRPGAHPGTDHAQSRRGGRADRRRERCDRDKQRAHRRIDPPRAPESAQGDLRTSRWVDSRWRSSSTPRPSVGQAQ